MVLGQSAAIAACLAIDHHENVVQRVAAETIWNEFHGNPLADGSLPEILVDNNNTSHVTLTGEWTTVPDWRAYGADFYAISPENKGTVKYTPYIAAETDYNVYIHFPKVSNISDYTTVSVFDGIQRREVAIKAADVVAEGRTSAEWVHIGMFHLPAGMGNYVEIANANATGIVVADAVLFIPDKKDKR
jgi:hypothetical protein